MELTDKQREWLGKAVRNKSRLTMKKTVKKQLKDYIGRRAKTANALAALPNDHKDYKTIEEALKAADKFADTGDLKSAYNALANAKAIAKAAASDRGGAIQMDAIRVEAGAIAQDLGIQVEEVNAARNACDDLIATINAAPKAGQESTYSKALEFLRDFIAEETRFRGLFNDVQQQCVTAGGNIAGRNIGSRLDHLSMQIAAVKASDRGSDVAQYEKQHARMKAAYDKDRFLQEGVSIRVYPQNKAPDFERAIMACKSLQKWQETEGEGTSEDSRTDNVRSGLTRDDAARKKLIDAENARLERARKEISSNKVADDLTFIFTGKGEISVAPEPAKFNAADSLDGLAGDEQIGDVVTDEQSDAVATNVKAKLTAFLTDTEVSKEELHDLSTKPKSELKTMIAKEVLGITDPNAWTETQQAMLEKAAVEAEKALCANLPNKIADDGSQVDIGGKVYKNPKVLKQGGKGKATKYTADDGSSVVVKTLLSTHEEDRENMVREMDTHFRAMQAADDDTSLVDFHGAARSPDGSLHMVLEDVDGGDLDDLNNGLSAATSLGVIPEQARQAIAVDNLLKTVKALKDMEKQGLVHHDLKGENVMMTSDGKIKIIDFGEADFLDDEGKIDGSPSGTTPGYDAPENFSKDSHDTKVDTFAIGAMLQRLVAETLPRVEDKGKRKMETGSLGRLVKALTDPDPAKRPSLDAILQSSLAKSYEQDFNAENVKDLQEASLDFAVQTTSIKGNVDLADLKSKLSDATGKVLEDPMKVKRAQEIVKQLERRLIDEQEKSAKNGDYYLKSGKAKIKELQQDIAVLSNQVVKKVLDDAVVQAEASYKSALDDPSIKVKIKVGKSRREMTLKKAVESRDALNKRMLESRTRVTEILNNLEESEELQEKVDKYNEEITRVFKVIKDIDAVIYKAVGREAKLFLAKVKMEKAATGFGSTASPQSEDPDVVEGDGVDDLRKFVNMGDTHDELKEAAS